MYDIESTYHASVTAIDQDFRVIAEQYSTKDLGLWHEEIDNQIDEAFATGDSFLRLSLRRCQRIIRSIIIERDTSRD